MTTAPTSPTRMLLRWLPAIAWMSVIFLLSSQGGLRATTDVDVEKPIRIVAHLGTYALLAGLFLYALCGRHAPGGRQLLLAVGLAAAYAVSDELHQALVPGRSGRADDVVVDVAGAVIGVALSAIVLATLERARTADGLERGSLDGDP
jgi:VanZ family protein